MRPEISEVTLRMAWQWASETLQLGPSITEQFSHLSYDPMDPGFRRPTLRGRSGDGSGSIAIMLSPAGRSIKIEAAWRDGFRMTTVAKLPKEKVRAP